MSIESICIFIFTFICASIHDVYGRHPIKITGGERASVYEFPSIVSIRFHGLHLCGGVFITAKHILTAGHCLSDDNELGEGVDWYPKSQITIASGTDNCYYPDNIHKIKNFTIHPLYRGSFSRHINDIAIIELKESVKFDETQKNIRLPDENTLSRVDGTVVGWGTSYEKEERLSELLKKADVVTISNTDCARRTHSFVHVGQLCASQPWGVGFCDGDSGGPLYNTKGEVMGIVSMSYDCGKGMPDVYTRVFHYLNWIRETIK